MKRLTYLICFTAFFFTNQSLGGDWPQGKPEYEGDYTPVVGVTAPYPKKAYKKKLEGFVELGFQVNSEGRTELIEVIKSTHKIFEKISVSALSKARYIPPERREMESPVTGLIMRYNFKSK